jgi:hypothetical protein
MRRRIMPFIRHLAIKQNKQGPTDALLSVSSTTDPGLSLPIKRPVISGPLTSCPSMATNTSFGWMRLLRKAGPPTIQAVTDAFFSLKLIPNVVLLLRRGGQAEPKVHSVGSSQSPTLFCSMHLWSGKLLLATSLHKSLANSMARSISSIVFTHSRRSMATSVYVRHFLRS